MKNDKYELSDDLRVKITKYKYLFYPYVIEFENYKNELTQQLFNKYDYNNVIKQYEANLIDYDVVKTYNYSILLDFHTERIIKLCSFVEIPIDEIEKITFDEFGEILKLNMDRSDLYISYVYADPINSETFIQLINVYLTDF